MSDLMTSRFPTMRDAGMPLPERINAAIDRIAHGNGHMRVPVEATDPDIVLGDCRVELESQAAQIAALKTVMVAAAEEIAAHWQAHCDAEGYGPQNLLRRLEEGIPSEYGYTAGAFAALTAERDLWVGLYRRAINEANGLTNYVEDRPELRSAEKRLSAIEAAARASLNTTTTRSEP